MVPDAPSLRGPVERLNMLANGVLGAVLFSACPVEQIDARGAARAPTRPDPGKKHRNMLGGDDDSDDEHSRVATRRIII